MKTESRWAALWRAIIIGEEKSWVAFENGTCVVLMEPGDDLAKQAIGLLTGFGPVEVGTPSADFQAIRVSAAGGWVVTCHHDDILTFVSFEDAGGDHDEFRAGLLGRTRRGVDAEACAVVHVEDRRRAGYAGVTT